MPEPLSNLFAVDIQWTQLALVALFVLAAWAIQRFSRWLALPLVGLLRLLPRRRRPSRERQATLHSLFAGAISFLVFAAAAVVSLSLFIDTETLIWIIGLFSAAFGLGARPVVSDFLSGVSFIFEDTFGVGEKVEIPIIGSSTIEGIVEAVNLRTTLLRAPSGELFTIPNGEIRVVRNFSRGKFSRADISFKIPAASLSAALPLLEALGEEAMDLLPNLLEPWQVISSSHGLGQHVELTLLAKARFGMAAEMRPRILALIQSRLEDAGIPLEG